MTYWRMAFRVGSRGDEMWPDCRKRGIAAIGYYTDRGDPIVGDCSRLTEDEYNAIWRRKDPKNTSGRASLRNVAYRMKVGDVIYVKEGPWVVGRGRVTKRYRHNPDVLKGAASEWEHYVKVDWEPDFARVPVSLGAELTTVLQLSGERLQKLEDAILLRDQEAVERIVAQDIDSLRAEEALFQEGNRRQRFTNYFERNPKLRAAAIQCHGTKCTVCGFDFERVYGRHGAGYIEVHHLRPVSSLLKTTTVDPRTEMAVLCSNCHRMIHRKKNGVLSLKEIQMIIDKSSRDRTPRNRLL
ncbi:MAG: HNH endonuclease [Candidatus Sumerlaeota bacterium]|nr:HNH endonuclease [Candidatus Sumerlaeota bacterium]